MALTNGQVMQIVRAAIQAQRRHMQQEPPTKPTKTKSDSRRQNTQFDQPVFVADTILRTVLDDDTWRWFGSRRRPRYGRAFKSIFASRTLEHEIAIAREVLLMLLVSAADAVQHSLRDPYSHAFLGRVFLFVLGGPGDPPHIGPWRSLGFDSRHEQVLYFTEALLLYAEKPAPTRAPLCASRLLATTPKNDRRAMVLHGVARLSVEAHDFANWLRHEIDKHLKDSPEFVTNIQVGPEFSSIAHAVLDILPTVQQQ